MCGRELRTNVESCPIRACIRFDSDTSGASIRMTRPRCCREEDGGKVGLAQFFESAA